VGLDAAAELLVQALDGVGRPGRSPLRRIEARKGEEPFSGFFEAVGDSAALNSMRRGDLCQVKLRRGVTLMTCQIALR
jgi:hypothetical protein